MSHHEEHGNGYEDPAQRPRPREGPSAFDHPGGRRGKWSGSTLMVAVVVGLLCGLAVLAIAGLLATR